MSLIYSKEKIARSLIPFEQSLAASFYGKFFARNLNLYLLQRQPEEWRTLQSNKTINSTKTDRQSSHPQPTSTVVPATFPEPSKRRGAPEDEIDAVFEAALGNKIKKAAAGRVSLHGVEPFDRQMSEVLGAIREAPSGESLGRKKRRKVGL